MRHYCDKDDDDEFTTAILFFAGQRRLRRQESFAKSSHIDISRPCRGDPLRTSYSDSRVFFFRTFLRHDLSEINFKEKRFFFIVTSVLTATRHFRAPVFFSIIGIVSRCCWYILSDHSVTSPRYSHSCYSIL